MYASINLIAVDDLINQLPQYIANVNLCHYHYFTYSLLFRLFTSLLGKSVYYYAIDYILIGLFNM